MALKAVFFDMDDTLLKPLAYNPWAEFKRRHGLPQDLLIVEGIQTRPIAEQAGITADLFRYERELALRSEVRPGMAELVNRLGQQGVHTALITNNHRQVVDFVVQAHGLDFPLVLTREDARPKPHPEMLLKALRHFGVSNQEAVYVGDSQGDLDAARAAGIETWFLATPHNLSYTPRFEYPEALLEALLERRQAGE